MTIVTSTELQSKIGSILDQALISPVQVTRKNRSIVVLLSTREYERLKALENAHIKSKKPARSAMFGYLRGKYKIASDFDAPLDDFKEYMK